MKTRDMCLIAMAAALLCLMGPVALPAGPVPVSIGSFAVYLTVGVLGSRRGAAAVLIYILLGTAGLPVFSGFTGGAAHLAGPTGGFILSYVPCAAIVGGACDRNWRGGLYAGMIAGTLTMYLLGTVWFMAQSGVTIIPALGACVLPFLPGDALKIALAGRAVKAVRQAMERGA